MKVPKDLKLKIGTEMEAFWTKVKDNAKAEVDNCEKIILLNKEILKVAEEKIKAEERVRKAEKKL